MSRIIAKFTVWFSRFYFYIEKRTAEPDLVNVFILRWNANQNGVQAPWMAFLDGSYHEFNCRSQCRQQK
jgi:hypothetical protein